MIGEVLGRTFTPVNPGSESGAGTGVQRYLNLREITGSGWSLRRICRSDPPRRPASGYGGRDDRAPFMRLCKGYAVI